MTQHCVHAFCRPVISLYFYCSHGCKEISLSTLDWFVLDDLKLTHCTLGEK
jgi:hypothetical protein